MKIYECLCDETRLRILNLLLCQPLRVWQLQKILRLPQVRISKHLAYLRQRRMVESFRLGNEIVYHLPRRRSRDLVSHLKCLQDCCRENPAYCEDRKRRLRPEFAAPLDFRTDRPPAS